MYTLIDMKKIMQLPKGESIRPAMLRRNLVEGRRNSV